MSSSNPQLEHLNNEVDTMFGTLRFSETVWRDHCVFLEFKGYWLRPRLRPGWEPSWRKTGDISTFSEDSLLLIPKPNLAVDATRTADGVLVDIKRVHTGDSESQIALYLSSEDLRKDSRNHSVSIIDYFQDSEDETTSYLVMPFLRPMDDPEFGSVEEMLAFGDQIFEGLVFMHEHGVAHRDCSSRNIMMDSSATYPQGFHPVITSMDSTFREVVHFYTRSERPVTCYYIDFGISVYIPLDQRPKLALGLDGRDDEVPELSNTVPYDPFKTDIFIIGILFKHKFFLKYPNVDFLLPLITALTQTDPKRRPDAKDALKIWKEVRQSVSYLNRVRRLRERECGTLPAAAWDATSFLRRGLRLSQWAPGAIRRY